MKRKICVITGSRAEYGLLRPLIKEIRDDSDLKMQLIVTGMHLSPEFGLTYKEIERDEFLIDEKIEILLSSDSPVGISKAMGLGMIGFGEAYARMHPDIVVLLGDRFELLSAAASALISKIPIAHLYGGEITQGVFDDSIRHAITKMSHLHFTSTEVYRKRVVQLGESPDRVFRVGAAGLDNIRNSRLLSKRELEQELNFKFDRYNLLVTFHPVTLENNTSKEQFRNLLEALDVLKETQIIFTKANADTYGRVINDMIDDYVLKNPHKSAAFTSMGQIRYLSMMKLVDGVVGNSSSGIVEAPALKVGTINIGDRQKGRIRTETVIDCKPVKESIGNAIKVLYSEEFKRNLAEVVNPYGDGKSAKRIKTILKKCDIGNISKKRFYDIL